MKTGLLHVGPDEVLATLDDRILDAVECTLSNDEGSADAEMAQYLMELGLSEAQAKRAISYWDLYRLNLWIDGCTPIRSGVRLRYDGETGQFAIA